jgi:oligopeptide transport system ATP-binding protein
MNELKAKINASIIMITHDLGVIAEVCDHIVVMYGGTIMEQGTEKDIFYNPQNPYTVGLHKSIPKVTGGEKKRLVPIEGSPPDLLHPPEGCPFSSRCPHTMKICLTERPPSFRLSETHNSACWLLHEEAPQVEKYEKAGALSE